MMALNEIILKLGVAVVAILLGILIARILGRLVQKILHEMHIDKRLKREGYGFKIEVKTRKLVNYIVYLFATIYALDQLGLTRGVLWFLSSIVFIVIVVFTYISMRDIFKDFTAGIKIHKNIQVGNIIKIGNVEGRVVKVSRTTVQIRTNNNELVFVPFTYIKSGKTD